MSTHASVGKKVQKQAKSLAESAKENPWIERWMRLGYAVRGLLYGMIGFLALQLMLTGRGKIVDRTGALATLAGQPFGKLLLIVVAVGAAGYAIWGLLRAVADPFNEGSDFKGLLNRGGAVITALSYGAFVVTITHLLQGSAQQGGQDTQNAQKAASGLFTHAWGPWVVGLVGLIIVGIGVSRIYKGWSNGFQQHFKYYAMSAEQHKWALRTGKIGNIALGIVLATIGILAVLAAFTLDASKVGGMDQALAFLIQQPYGTFVLGFVALGLIAYAVYSWMGAIWFRIKTL